MLNTCNLRHPKSCKYKEKCKRKSSCVYEHENLISKTHNKNVVKENEKLKIEMSRLNELLVNTAAKLENLTTKFENFIQNVENKEISEMHCTATQTQNVMNENSQREIKVKVVKANEPDDLNEVFFVPKEEPYKCNKCLFKCMDNVVMKNHTDKEHSVKCGYCKFTFKDTHRLENHVNIAHKHMTPMLQELMERQFPLFP